MKALLILILMMIVAGGCVSAESKQISADGQKSIIKYSRLGDQEISGFTLAKDPNGIVSISLDQQKSEAQMAKDVIAAMLEALKIGVALGQGVPVK